MNKNHKRTKEPISMVLYCLAGIIGVYVLITIYNSHTYISGLVSQKGLVVSEQLLSVITYYVNASLPYLFYSIAIWGIGYIIDKFNSLNIDKGCSGKVSVENSIVNEEEDLDAFVNEIKSQS